MEYKEYARALYIAIRMPHHHPHHPRNILLNLQIGLAPAATN